MMSTPLHFENPDKVIEQLQDFVSEKRHARILEVLEGRSDKVTLVLENLFDLGNINAIIRSAENFGVESLHIVESQTVGKLKRTTRGAHQWVDIHKENDIHECVAKLKKQGYKIGVTSFAPHSRSLDKLDWQEKWAFVLGREKTGCSDEAMSVADALIHIPTVGFSQSLNVSVAAAILVSHAFFQRHQKGNLSEERKKQLRALWIAKSVPSRMLEPLLRAIP